MYVNEYVFTLLTVRNIDREKVYNIVRIERCIVMGGPGSVTFYIGLHRFFDHTNYLI